MKKQPSSNPESQVLIDISTAIIRVDANSVQCRIVIPDSPSEKNAPPARLPFGPFVPDEHRTMEIGLRQWVHEQVGVALGHVEQLYTFADRGRHTIGQLAKSHIVSVGYLALTNQPQNESAEGAWQNVYLYFPWEDWRDGRPEVLDTQVLPALRDWLATQTDKAAVERARRAFGLHGHEWDEEQVLERYELLYEAGLVAEAQAQSSLGLSLQLDHRRILATALGRLRGKLKYRPVIFDLMPPRFTLTRLQHTTEAVMGVCLHKQNFRRLVEKSGLVVSTGDLEKARGRPAELYRFAHGERAERPLAGLRISGGRGKRRRDAV